MNEDNSDEEDAGICKENGFAEVFELNTSTASSISSVSRAKENSHSQERRRRKPLRKPLRTIIRKKTRNHLQRYHHYSSALADQHPVVLDDDERLKVSLPTASAAVILPSNIHRNKQKPSNRNDKPDPPAEGGANQSSSSSFSTIATTTTTTNTQLRLGGAKPCSTHYGASITKNNANNASTTLSQRRILKREETVSQDNIENDGHIHSFLRQTIQLRLGAAPKQPQQVPVVASSSSVPLQNRSGESESSSTPSSSNCTTTTTSQRETKTNNLDAPPTPCASPKRNPKATPTDESHQQPNHQQTTNSIIPKKEESLGVERTPPPTPPVSPERNRKQSQQQESSQKKKVSCTPRPKKEESLGVERTPPPTPPVSPERNRKQSQQQESSQKKKISCTPRQKMKRRFLQESSKQHDDDRSTSPIVSSLLLGSSSNNNKQSTVVAKSSPKSVLSTGAQSSTACTDDDGQGEQPESSLVLFLDEYSGEQYSVLLDNIHTMNHHHHHHLERVTIFRHRDDRNRKNIYARRTDEELQALFQILRHRSISKTLRQVELWNFQAHDVSTLAHGFKNSFQRLECLQLHLESGTLSPDLTNALGTLPSLVSLEVKVHERFPIAPLLKRPQSLKILGIIMNQHYELPCEDVEAIAMALLPGNCSSSVEVLDIEPVMKSVSLRRLLGAALQKNQSLETLQFSCGCETMEDGDETLAVLLEALVPNHRLRVVWNHHYESIMVSDATKQRVLDVLKEHPTIEEFYVFAEDPEFATQKHEMLKAQRILI
jgi:hypothetical protein